MTKKALQPTDNQQEKELSGKPGVDAAVAEATMREDNNPEGMIRKQ